MWIIIFFSRLEIIHTANEADPSDKSKKTQFFYLPSLELLSGNRHFRAYRNSLAMYAKTMITVHVIIVNKSNVLWFEFRHDKCTNWYLFPIKWRQCTRNRKLEFYLPSHVDILSWLSGWCLSMVAVNVSVFKIEKHLCRYGCVAHRW